MTFDASYDLRVALLWRRLRTFFYEFLGESKEADFNKTYTFDSTVDPLTARGLLEILARQRGGAKPLKIILTVVGSFKRTQLAVTDLCSLSPTSWRSTSIIRRRGWGASESASARRATRTSARSASRSSLRIGSRCRSTAGCSTAGTTYKFTVELATWTFLNPTGLHDHPPCEENKKLSDSKRGRIVAHVKTLVKEPAATMASLA